MHWTACFFRSALRGIRSSFLMLLLMGGCVSNVVAQEMFVYANGSLGIDRNYASVGVKYYRKRADIFSFEAGGGLLGMQNETAGAAADMNGQNGFGGSISSSVVIAPDGNTPDHMFVNSVKTRFTGTFFRGSYEWRFPSKKETDAVRPSGFHIGVELAYFDLIQHQDVDLHSTSGAGVYDYHGTAECKALAPGLRMGYDLIFLKNGLFTPEIASPFYIPVGNHAKSNGPFAKQAIEVRVGIGWFIR